MNYVMIENMMVDTDTGEILNITTEGQITSAIEFLERNVDISEVVDELVNEICGTKSLITTSLTSPKKTGQGTGGGPKPKTLINNFRKQIEDATYNGLPQWLDDVIYGSQRAHTGNTSIPFGLILHILSIFDEISTKKVLDHLNLKRRAVGDDEVSNRYAQQIVASCRNAISAIQFQLDKGMEWYKSPSYTTSLTSDAEEWEKEKAQHVTIDRDTLIKNLTAAGLNDKEIENYLNGKLISA